MATNATGRLQLFSIDPQLTEDLTFELICRDGQIVAARQSYTRFSSIFTCLQNQLVGGSWQCRCHSACQCATLLCSICNRDGFKGRPVKLHPNYRLGMAEIFIRESFKHFLSTAHWQKFRQLTARRRNELVCRPDELAKVHWNCQKNPVGKCLSEVTTLEVEVFQLDFGLLLPPHPPTDAFPNQFCIKARGAAENVYMKLRNSGDFPVELRLESVLFLTQSGPAADPIPLQHESLGVTLVDEQTKQILVVQPNSFEEEQKYRHYCGSHYPFMTEWRKILSPLEEAKLSFSFTSCLALWQISPLLHVIPVFTLAIPNSSGLREFQSVHIAVVFGNFALPPAVEPTVSSPTKRLGILSLPSSTPPSQLLNHPEAQNSPADELPVPSEIAQSSEKNSGRPTNADDPNWKKIAKRWATAKQRRNGHKVTRLLPKPIHSDVVQPQRVRRGLLGSAAIPDLSSVDSLKPPIGDQICSSAKVREEFNRLLNKTSLESISCGLPSICQPSTSGNFSGETSRPADPSRESLVERLKRLADQSKMIAETPRLEMSTTRFTERQADFLSQMSSEEKLQLAKSLVQSAICPSTRAQLSRNEEVIAELNVFRFKRTPTEDLGEVDSQLPWPNRFRDDKGHL